MVQRLIESFSNWKGAEEVELKPIPIESKMMVESNGKSFEVTGAYEVPVWRLDEENLNGRKYPTAVAKKVIQENRVTISLKNHPEDGKDGSVDDIVAVGKNPRIRVDEATGKSVLWVECYFVDEDFQRKVEKVRKLGSGIGLSSCALGELDDTGSVLAESFVLERYFDFVISPSYGVFVDDKAKPLTMETKQESQSNHSEPTNSMLHEKTMGDKKVMMTLEEKNYRYGVRPLKAAAEALTDPFEKRSAWQDIAVYAEGLSFASDDQKLAEQKIAEANAEIEALAKAGQTVDQIHEEKKVIEEKTEAVSGELAALQEALGTVSSEYEVALDVIENLTSRDAKLKELYRLTQAERNGRLKASKVKQIMDYVKFLEKEVDRMKSTYVKALNEQKASEDKAMRYLSAKQKLELAALKAKLSEDYETTITSDEEPEISVVGDETVVSDQPVGVDAVDAPIDVEGAYPEEEYEDDITDVSDMRDLHKHHIAFGSDFQESEEISAYYNDLVQANPAVRKIREQIFACKTLRDAERIYMNLIEFASDSRNLKTKSVLQEAKKPFRVASSPSDEWYKRRKDWV